MDNNPGLKPGAIVAIPIEAHDGSGKEQPFSTQNTYLNFTFTSLSECLAVLAELRDKEKRKAGCSSRVQSILLDAISAMPSLASLVAKGSFFFTFALPCYRRYQTFFDCRDWELQKQQKV